jgi:hypothetical protein
LAAFSSLAPAPSVTASASVTTFSTIASSPIPSTRTATRLRAIAVKKFVAEVAGAGAQGECGEEEAGAQLEAKH